MKSEWFGNLLIGAAVVLALAAALSWYAGDAPNQKEPVTGQDQPVVSHDQVAAVDKADSASSTRGDPSPREASSRSLVSLPDHRKSDWQQWDDPSSDGWETELFHQQAKQQLKKLGKIIAHAGQGIDSQKLAALVTEDFSCDALVPTALQTVVDDGEFTVQRLATDKDETPASKSDRRAYVAAEGFSGALADLLSVIDSEAAIDVQFKVVRVIPAESDVITRQLVEISGPRADGSVEQHATWQIRWSIVDEKYSRIESPKIKSIDVEDFEQTTLKNSQGRIFADCTESVLAENRCYQEQLLYGHGHWLQRSQDDRYMAVLGTPGIAVGDVNNDGLEDLYLCQETGLPNLLFLQNRDGTVREVSAEWGVDWLEWSRSALLVDLDNDGDRDLAVAVLGGIVLAENVDGAGFRYRSVVPTPEDIMSLSAVDYDQDGRLDFHTCIYYPNADINETSSSVMATESDNFIFHDANTGGRNTLLRNVTVADGPWQFEDVTEKVGMVENNHRFSFAATWDDFDNDGDQDVYVANDYGRDHLYQQEQLVDGSRQFVDVAPDANAEDSAGGMGVTCADYDRDGWIDTYVSNMFSSAGNRVAFRPEFIPGEVSETRQRLQRFARGNTLLRNVGTTSSSGISFEDVSEPAALTMGRWAWSSNFCDINNDGWEDLLVANGYVTGEIADDL